MQVFNTFFKIAKKQLPSALIYVGIFIGICVMMGASVREGMSTYSVKSCHLVVVDRDNSEASAMLIKYLSGIHDVDADSDYTDEQIQDYLFFQRIDYVLYIEKGYETTGELTNVKRPGSSVGTYIDNQIDMYEGNMRALTNGGYSLEAAYDLTIKAASAEGLVTLMTGDNETPPIYNCLTYLPFVIISVMFFVLAPVLVAFNRKDVNARLNVSPITSGSKNVQIALGQIIVSIIVWAAFIAFVCIYYGTGDVSGKLPLIMLNCMGMVVVSASMAGIAGNLQLSGNLLSIIANVTSLGMCFLGGVFVPTEFFSKGMLAVAKFMPTYWYIDTNDKIFGGGSIGDIAGGLGIELLFALAFFMVAIVVSKRMRVARSS